MLTVVTKSMRVLSVSKEVSTLKPSVRCHSQIDKRRIFVLGSKEGVAIEEVLHSEFLELFIDRTVVALLSKFKISETYSAKISIFFERKSDIANNF